MDCEHRVVGKSQCCVCALLCCTACLRQCVNCDFDYCLKDFSKHECLQNQKKSQCLQCKVLSDKVNSLQFCDVCVFYLSKKKLIQ